MINNSNWYRWNQLPAKSLDRQQFIASGDYLDSRANVTLGLSTQSSLPVIKVPVAVL
jgi:hypothetical protein